MLMPTSLDFSAPFPPPSLRTKLKLAQQTLDHLEQGLQLLLFPPIGVATCSPPTPLLLSPPIPCLGVGHRKLEFYALRTTLPALSLKPQLQRKKTVGLLPPEPAKLRSPLPFASPLPSLHFPLPPALHHRAQGEAESHLIFGF